MESNAVIDATSQSSDQVMAYKYRLDINDGGGYSARNFMTLTEYYIPSNKICFNRLDVFNAEKPRNIWKKRPFYLRSEPLTPIWLSKTLVKSIKDIAQASNSKEDIQEILKNNDEYQSLFKAVPPKTMVIGNEIIKIKDGFWDRYKNKGNNVIKKAIIQFVMEGTTPEKIAVNGLVELAKKMSPIERESLIESINSTLSIENGRLIEERKSAIENIERSHEKHDLVTTGILAGISATVISTLVRINPVIAFGIGFLDGYGLHYLYGEWNKFSENQLWDERESRLKMIYEAINNSQPDTNAEFIRLSLK